MDNKASIKLEFAMYGKEFKTEMYINYFPTDNGVDERVTEFFRESYNKAVQNVSYTKKGIQQLESELATAKEEIERLKMDKHK
jgi:hypothetical protein